MIFFKNCSFTSRPSFITALDVFESKPQKSDTKRFQLLFGTIFDHCRPFLCYVRVKSTDKAELGGMGGKNHRKGAEEGGQNVAKIDNVIYGRYLKHGPVL